jgi:hypothetical protein
VRKNPKAIAIPQIKTLEEADAHQRKHGFPAIISAREKQLDRVHGAVDLNDRKPKKLRGVEPPKMNQTEREFSVLLLAQKVHGQILDFVFQGLRLRWGGGMNYKADFTVRRTDGGIVVIEVKGPQIWDRDIVRFKGCRAEWKDWFDFQMHQRAENKTWSRLL